MAKVSTPSGMYPGLDLVSILPCTYCLPFKEMHQSSHIYCSPAERPTSIIACSDGRVSEERFFFCQFEGEKFVARDLDIGKDFLSSWKSISIVEGDAMDFDLTPGNKKSFNFDKADMDFNLDGDFGKMSSFNMDMSDLDISPPLKKDGKPNEKPKESSSGKEKGKSDRFAFAFDFDELNNFNLESNLSKEGSKSKKESSPSASVYQDKECSMHMKQLGGMTTSEDAPRKQSLPGTVITFDMDSLVGGSVDLELTKEDDLSNLAMVDAVTSENSAAIHEVASDKAKSHPETKIASSKLRKVGEPNKLVSAEPVGRDDVKDLFSDSLFKNEPPGGNSSESKHVANSINKNATVSNEKQDVSVMSMNSSSRHFKHTSENSRLFQTVEILEKNNDEKSKVGVEGHVINNRERTELGQVKSSAENSCTTSDVSEIHCDSPSGRGNHELASRNVKLALVSKPAALSEKETAEGREPRVTCSKYFVQSWKPKCHVAEASKQTTLSLLSNKKMGFTQSNPVEGRRDGFNTESDQILVSLPLQCSKIPVKELSQMQKQESCTALKISREVCSADGLENVKKLDNSSTTLNKDTSKTKSVVGQRNMIMKDLDNLRSSCASFPMEIKKDAAQNSCNPKPLATIPLSKDIPAGGHKLSSVECGRKTPHLRGLKLQCLNIESTKSPTRKEPLRNIGQNRVLLRETPSDITHFPNSLKQTPPSLSTKRKALEEDAANTIALHPSKRLVQSPTASRNVVETPENILDKKEPNHSNKEIESVKSTVVSSQVSTFHIPHEAKTEEVKMSISVESDKNVKQAGAYAKELGNLCHMLKKKHDEAKEILVQAIVNSNKLLMLNNPLLDEKNIFARLNLNSLHD
ncbi:hypothetical protein OROGR_016952 [Orobanche gracilis]